MSGIEDELHRSKRTRVDAKRSRSVPPENQEEDSGSINRLLSPTIPSELRSQNHDTTNNSDDSDTPSEQIRYPRRGGFYHSACPATLTSPETSSSDVTITNDTPKTAEDVPLGNVCPSQGVENLTPLQSSRTCTSFGIGIGIGGADGSLHRRPVLDNIPKEILQKILQHVFPVSDTIAPWYPSGTLTIGIRGWSENDSGVTFNPNLETAFLRLNKACHRMGTDILYGTNHFQFARRPDCCKWWLQRIGDGNLHKINVMSFIMNSGWLDDRRNPSVHPSCFDSSHEELWAKALHHVQKRRVKLVRLNIITMKWTDLAFEYKYRFEDKVELNKYRKLIVDVLERFRNIENVDVQQFGGTWIGHHEATKLKLLMRQRTSMLPEEPPLPRLSLTELMDHLRAERQIESKRIVHQSRSWQARTFQSSSSS